MISFISSIKKFCQEIFLNAINENESEKRRLNDLQNGEDSTQATLGTSEPPSISVTPEPEGYPNRPSTPIPDAAVYSSDSEDEDDTRLLEGRTISAAGQQVISHKQFIDT